MADSTGREHRELQVMLCVLIWVRFVCMYLCAQRGEMHHAKFMSCFPIHDFI